MTEDKTGSNDDSKSRQELVKVDDDGASEVTSANRRAVWLSLVFFVITLVLISVSSWFLYRQIQVVSLSANINADSARSINQKIEENIKQLYADIEQLRLQQQQQADSLTALYQRFPKDVQAWALTEVEYLLIIAGHRLLLEKDINTALVAMELADLRLRDLGDPALIPVREQLAADMNALRDVDKVDISGLAIYLADLIERSGSLPLKEMHMETIPQSDDETALTGSEEGSRWTDLPSTIWNELKSLVVIKRSGETRQALLLPDQEYFLYQNLRLELENARLAVLQRDTENLHTSVALLLDWLDEYFDSENTSVMNVTDTLQKIAGLNLEVKTPDISSSLETLRAYMHERDFTPPGSE